MGLYFLYLFSSPFLSQAIPVAWFCLFYKLLSHYNKFLYIYIYIIWLFLYFSLGDGKNCLLIEGKKMNAGLGEEAIRRDVVFA